MISAQMKRLLDQLVIDIDSCQLVVLALVGGKDCLHALSVLTLLGRAGRRYLRH
jgi:hypothetical protein